MYGTDPCLAAWFSRPVWPAQGPVAAKREGRVAPGEQVTDKVRFLVVIISAVNKDILSPLPTVILPESPG